MKPQFYIEQWRRLRGEADAEAVEALAVRVANSFIDRYFYNDEYNADYVRLLCEMATAFPDESLNNIAARALFGIVIERLCDDFEESQIETYNRLMSQIIEFLRHSEGGEELHSRLNKFGLHSEDDLFQRIEAIRLQAGQPLPEDAEPRMFVVLSRVTIGADVAITSVICERLQAQFPEAEMTVIGNRKLRQLIHSCSGIRVLELDYARRGGLMERFTAWLDLQELVERETDHYSYDGDFMVFDPDSRLTQLGVLPLVDDRYYRFFNSRGGQGHPSSASLSDLTNLWMDNILQTTDHEHPSVWHPMAECIQTKRRIKGLQRDGRHLIAVNLGVGGNERKRVSDEFERELVLHLLADPANTVLLDMGFGESERRRSEAIIAAAEAAGFTARSTAFNALDSLPPQTRLVGVECSLVEVIALILHSNEFIGYDSACQHIAAALAVPTYTIFAGTTNPRFVRRWRPCGPNRSEVLFVDTISRHPPPDPKEIIARLQDLRQG